MSKDVRKCFLASLVIWNVASIGAWLWIWSLFNMADISRQEKNEVTVIFALTEAWLILTLVYCLGWHTKLFRILSDITNALAVLAGIYYLFMIHPGIVNLLVPAIYLISALFYFCSQHCPVKRQTG
ncbi:hypothetical protein STSP2_00586 [Anaerohalosphaera lusitana]|uniref:Uncharacterized protein n=1 Tax=Anaerohalosphaera lusitana TaxID=1936003 RepID=A0A1U9NHP3_9BACT|nr:hypothetical protein [Anaerohalosphaera lusitana]AQT67439.1 hypothetical protein STSP2_00586 [Anaerohalosphaera lusitana]